MTRLNRKRVTAVLMTTFIFMVVLLLLGAIYTKRSPVIACNIETHTKELERLGRITVYYSTWKFKSDPPWRADFNSDKSTGYSVRFEARGDDPCHALSALRSMVNRTIKEE